MYEWMYAKKVKNEQLMRLRQAPSLSTKVDLEGLDVNVLRRATNNTPTYKNNPSSSTWTFVRKAREKKPKRVLVAAGAIGNVKRAGKPCSDSFRCRPGSLARCVSMAEFSMDASHTPHTTLSFPPSPPSSSHFFIGYFHLNRIILYFLLKWEESRLAPLLVFHAESIPRSHIILFTLINLPYCLI